MRIERVSTGSKGFTAVELLVTLAIVAILAAIAIPTIRTSSATSEANALYGALEFARSSAVKNGQSVLVCPTTTASATSPTCSTGSTWTGGWLVVAQGDGTCTISTSTGSANGDVVLQTQPKFSGKDTADFTGSNVGFCFTRMGFAYSAYTGMVTFKTSPAVARNQRCTMVSGVGHIQVVSQGKSDALGTTCT